jgi:hypothetical protein
VLSVEGNHNHKYVSLGAHLELFIFGADRGAEPEAMYNLCLILKIIKFVSEL